MSRDDKEFEEIYQSLAPGLVIVACSPKSLRTLRSFCFSLKGAAIRCDSDAILVSTGGTRINWEAVGAQIVEHGSQGIRVFLINRFEDPSPASVIVRLNSERGLDGLDGSIDHNIAETLQQTALANNCTFVVTTVAGKERQIRDRRVARLLGKEQGVFVALEHARMDDDWYSATVTAGENEKSYGPLGFVSECPQPPEVQPQSESVAGPNKPSAEVPAKRGQSWLRRLFG
jgi:hypothetical protein